MAVSCLPLPSGHSRRKINRLGFVRCINIKASEVYCAVLSRVYFFFLFLNRIPGYGKTPAEFALAPEEVVVRVRKRFSGIVCVGEIHVEDMPGVTSSRPTPTTSYRRTPLARSASILPLRTERVEIIGYEYKLFVDRHWMAAPSANTLFTSPGIPHGWCVHVVGLSWKLSILPNFLAIIS